MARKLVLIDGNGLAYRAFYAVPSQVTGSGVPANAVLGFTNMLFNVVLAERPTHLAVAFDQSAFTERMRHHQEYNAQGEEMPDDLARQLPLIEEAVRACGIPVYRLRGYEADDCIGTLARRAEGEGFTVLILAGDLNLLQLVGPRVRVMTTRRGLGDLVVYDEAMVRQRFHLEPGQLADLRALAGDSAQSIAGVPGIGEVTARKLLSQYRSLEDLLGSLASLPAKWRNPLSESRQQALDDKARATIRTDLELDCCWERCAFRGFPLGRLARAFRRLDLEGILEMAGASRVKAFALEEDDRFEVRLVDDPAALESLARSGGALALSWVLEGSEVAGVALARDPHGAWYVPAERLPAEQVWRALRPALEDPGRSKYVHHLHRLADRLSGLAGHFDVAVASALLDAGERDHRLSAIARRSGVEIPGEECRSGAALEEVAEWAGRRVAALAAIGPVLQDRVRREGLEGLLREVEQPLVEAFAHMSRNRLVLHRDRVDQLAREVERMREDLRDQLHAEAGGEFDIGCDRELSEFLFDNLGLPGPAGPKNGGSLSAELLGQLGEQHEAAGRARDYRELSEFQFRFVAPLSDFNGRSDLSSAKAFHPSLLTEGRRHGLGSELLPPNMASFHRMMGVVDDLQNPVYRNRIRHLLETAVVPSEGHLLLLAELPDLVLRVLAYLSGDRRLGEDLEKGRDIAGQVASELYGIPPGQATPEMRRTAEAVAVQAMGPHGLARRLDLPLKEARRGLERAWRRFGDRYPRAAEFLEEQVHQARRQGHVTTLDGRRRWFPELASRNLDIRETAERMARSAAVEGSAFDLVKRAVVAIHRRSRNGGFPARPVMQIFHQFLFEVEEDQAGAAGREIRRAFQEIWDLSVPLEVRIRSGESWSEALGERELELAGA